MANKHMERYSTSLVIRKMQIKNTIRYHFTSTMTAIIKETITSVDEGVQKLETPYIAGGNGKLFSHIF